MLLRLKSRIGLALVVLLTAMALMAAACGGGDDDDGRDPTDAPTAAPTDGGDDDGDGTGGSGDGDGEAFEDVYPVNQTFWHSGFMVEIGDAIHGATEPDIFGEQEVTLTLEATFTNEGADADYLFAVVSLVTPDGTSVFDPGFGGLPTVAGGLSGDGEYIFRVEENFSIEDAYILVGDADEQQARVPLGPGGGELISLEPSEGPLTDSLSISLLDLDFTSWELRADDPSSHRQIEAGKLALTLYFDATSRRSGNWIVFATEFALMTPDATSVPVARSDLPGLPGSDAGLTTDGLFLRFLVDDPANGDYVLQYSPADSWLEDGDPTELTLELEL